MGFHVNIWGSSPTLHGYRSMDTASVAVTRKFQSIAYAYAPEQAASEKGLYPHPHARLLAARCEIPHTQG